MKKLMLMATFVVATLGFAGVKDDYVKAQTSYQKTGDINVYKSTLMNVIKEKAVTPEDNKSLLAATLDLYKISLATNMVADAKKYGNELLTSKDLTASDKEAVRLDLFRIALLQNNIKEAFDILATLQKNNPKNQNFQELKVALYAKEKNSKENTYYRIYTKSLKGDDKAKFDLGLASVLAQLQLVDKAKFYAGVALKEAKDVKLLEDINLSLSSLYFGTKDYKTSLKYALAADKLAKGQNVLAKVTLFNVYKELKDNTKSIEQLKEANVLTKESNPQILLGLIGIYTHEGKINDALNLYAKFDKVYQPATVNEKADELMGFLALAEQAKNTKYIAQIRSEFQFLQPANQKNDVDLLIAQLALEKNMLDIAKKYAEVSTNKAATNVLAVVAYREGDSNKALSLLDKAVKDNVPGAKELKTQLLEAMKQNKK